MLWDCFLFCSLKQIRFVFLFFTQNVKIVLFISPRPFQLDFISKYICINIFFISRLCRIERCLRDLRVARSKSLKAAGFADFYRIAVDK